MLFKKNYYFLIRFFIPNTTSQCSLYYLHFDNTILEFAINIKTMKTKQLLNNEKWGKVTWHYGGGTGLRLLHAEVPAADGR